MNNLSRGKVTTLQKDIHDNQDEALDNVADDTHNSL
jgi:hypothetical protein